MIPSNVNPNMGAIAMGHPLGMAGVRLDFSAAHQLKRSGGRYVLWTMCVGIGRGTAIGLERAQRQFWSSIKVIRTASDTKIFLRRTPGDIGDGAVPDGFAPVEHHGLVCHLLQFIQRLVDHHNGHAGFAF